MQMVISCKLRENLLRTGNRCLPLRRKFTSKYGRSFCDSTGIPAAAEPGKALENRIVGIARPLPATRQ